MDIFPKFIIETDQEISDCLIIAKCTYHKQLVTDYKNVKGGGWWSLEDSVFTLRGSSEDFGRASVEDIRQCVGSGNVFTNRYLTRNIVDDYKFRYDTGSEVIDLN